MEITQGVRFDSLGLSEEIMRALEKKNYEVSTPIQAGCIMPPPAKAREGMISPLYSSTSGAMP